MGRGHHEFSTNKQQDAEEFIRYISCSYFRREISFEVLSVMCTIKPKGCKYQSRISYFDSYEVHFTDVYFGFVLRCL